MSISEILKYTKGYLTVKVTGLNPEKFLNMCVAREIYLWDIHRISLTEIKLNISIRGYRAIKKFIRKTGCTISIVDKCGLPFFMFKIKKRKMLAVGFVVFILLTLAMSSFIWSVEVIGAETISSEEIKKNLAELGVKPGAFKLDIAVSEIENQMLINMDKLSWIKVKLHGTRAEVEVKERTSPVAEVPKNKPCDIVASRDGVIVSIVSEQGDVVVSEGEPVRKGQVLVKGTIERENIETRYVHSSATIQAKTWYEGEVAVPLESFKMVRSGRKVLKIYLIIGSRAFNIKNSNISYKNYDKIEKSIKFIETDRFELPLELVIEEYHETVSKPVTKTVEEAKTEAAAKVEKQIIDNIGQDAKIIDKKIKLSYKDNIVIASALIETLEDIGQKKEINISRED